MASIAVQLASPAPSPNFGNVYNTAAYNNTNTTTPAAAPTPSSATMMVSTISNSEPFEINLQQVGEEVEGIVMLSLLKQKLESFSEVIRQHHQRRSSEERDSDEEYGRGKRRTAANNSNGNNHSSGSSSPKRRRVREDELTDISSRNSWMENYTVVKRLSQLHDHERRQIEVIQMNEWIEQQHGLYNRRMLSEERVELLRLIGVEVDIATNTAVAEDYYDRSPSSPDPNWGEDYGNDEDDDELSSSGKEQSPPLRKKRSFYRSSPSSPMPASPLTEKRNKKFLGGKKKANLKRNSLHNWVYNQRRLQYEGNLPVHRKKLLDKIGFDWKWVQQKIDEERMMNPDSHPREEDEGPMMEPIPNSKSEELWMTRYRELIDFKERHGHYEVPRYVE